MADAPAPSGGPPSRGRFVGKRALVTGAGSGIGRAVARRLAAEGAQVVGFDVCVEGMAQTFADIAGAQAVALDVTSAEAVEAVRAADEPYDVLVNAAGVLLRHDALAHPLEAWEQTLAVNLKAPIRLSRALASAHVVRSEPQGGECSEVGDRAAGRSDATAAIVNVCSVESFVAIPGHAAYTASKAALLMATRAFALELAPHGIRVNGVAPGVTATGMNAAVRADPDRGAALARAVPLGRFATAEEQAAGICFLASAEASYVTGAVLSIDGGWLVR